MKIGQKLRKLREESDKTMAEIGHLVGISKQNLYKYEQGIITNIPSDKIEALAKVFRVSPAYLMGWADLEGNSTLLNISDLTSDQQKAVRDYIDSCRRLNRGG